MTVATKTWKTVLGDEKHKPYFREIMTYIDQRRSEGVTIYPDKSDIFNAFKYTPFDSVKVVIIGQDPYHGPGQAHGLCFSVKPNIPIPPSLQNIFKELHADLDITPPACGCLTKWAEQGVLLLNATLTVEQGKPQSHANIGWKQFTDHVIHVLNEEKDGLVFLLWGAYAQSKANMIDPIRHCILQSTHPSPLSANRGFLGCRHFSKANAMLQKLGKTPVNWNLNI